MSCSQVMYQPYSSYFPYPQRPSATGHHHHHHHQSATASIFGANSFGQPMDTSRSGLSAFSDSSSAATPLLTSVSNNNNNNNNNQNSITSVGTSRIKLLDPSSPEPTGQSSSSATATNSRKESQSPVKESSVSSHRSVTGEQRTGSASSSAGSSGGGAQAAGGGGGLRDSAADAQYISANCVVFTYFSGDSSSVVDQHFSRALSQQQTYQSNDKSHKDGTGGEVVPMSQRSFPPSFWNINHQPVLAAHHHSSHTSSSGPGGLCLPSGSSTQVHELYAAADAYHTGALHPGSLHHQNDPWHYTLSAAGAGNPYSAHHHHHHRAAAAASIHDLSSYSTSNRFGTPYSSLLLQPASMRSTRLTPVSATCTGPFEKSGAPDMTWPTSARYHHESAMNFAGHHSMDPANYSASAAYGAAMTAAMSGLENQVQDTSKDLYWF